MPRRKVIVRAHRINSGTDPKQEARKDEEFVQQRRRLFQEKRQLIDEILQLLNLIRKRKIVRAILGLLLHLQVSYVHFLLG